MMGKSCFFERDRRFPFLSFFTNVSRFISKKERDIVIVSSIIILGCRYVFYFVDSMVCFQRTDYFGGNAFRFGDLQCYLLVFVQIRQCRLHEGGLA